MVECGTQWCHRGKTMGVGVRDWDLNPDSVIYIFNYIGQVFQRSRVSSFTSVTWGCNATQDESILPTEGSFDICRHCPHWKAPCPHWNLSYLPWTCAKDGLDLVTCFQWTEFRKGKIVTKQQRNLENTTWTKWWRLRSPWTSCDYHLFPDMMWCTGHATPVVVFSQTLNSSLIVRNTSDQVRLENILQGTWPVSSRL